MPDQNMISREELHALVWETPMIHAAAKYGLSGNGLAKICRKLDVPYPPRGWWAKKAAGKRLRQTPLPQAKGGTPTAAAITMRRDKGAEAGADLTDELETVGEISVPERLARPHPVIAAWRSDREEKRRKASRERDPWMRAAWSVPEFTNMEKKGHRVLHALLRSLEKAGALVGDGDKPGRVFVTVSGERIELEVREKLKQVKRPLNDDEKRWRSDHTRLVTELVGTGRLHVVIHTWTGPGFRRDWLESDRQPLETLLREVAATVLAMGPHLAQLRREREEQARLYEKRRRQAEADRRRMKLEANRWRRFVELARTADEVRQARMLIAQLQAQGATAEKVGGKTISDWLDWAEERVNAVDPLQRGAGALFADVAEVTEWTYRE